MALRALISVTPSELNAKIVSNVDLYEFGQPHGVCHECESVNHSLVRIVGEVNNTPLVEWTRFVANDRVLDVKQRLSSTGAK